MFIGRGKRKFKTEKGIREKRQKATSENQHNRTGESNKKTKKRLFRDVSNYLDMFLLFANQ